MREEKEVEDSFSYSGRGEALVVRGYRSGSSRGGSRWCAKSVPASRTERISDDRARQWQRYEAGKQAVTVAARCKREGKSKMLGRCWERVDGQRTQRFRARNVPTGAKHSVVGPNETRSPALTPMTLRRGKEQERLQGCGLVRNSIAIELKAVACACRERKWL